MEGSLRLNETGTEVVPALKLEPKSLPTCPYKRQLAFLQAVGSEGKVSAEERIDIACEAECTGFVKTQNHLGPIAIPHAFDHETCPIYEQPR